MLKADCLKKYVILSLSKGEPVEERLTPNPSTSSVWHLKTYHFRHL